MAEGDELGYRIGRWVLLAAGMTLFILGGLGISVAINWLRAVGPYDRPGWFALAAAILVTGFGLAMMINVWRSHIR